MWQIAATLDKGLPDFAERDDIKAEILGDDIDDNIPDKKVENVTYWFTCAVFGKIVKNKINVNPEYILKINNAN